MHLYLLWVRESITLFRLWDDRIMLDYELYKSIFSHCSSIRITFNIWFINWLYVMCYTNVFYSNLIPLKYFMDIEYSMKY